MTVLNDPRFRAIKFIKMHFVNSTQRHLVLGEKGYLLLVEPCSNPNKIVLMKITILSLIYKIIKSFSFQALAK